MTYRIFILLFLGFGFSACDDDDDLAFFHRDRFPDDVTGLNYVATADGDFTATYASITAQLNGKPGVSVVAEVDHQANVAVIGKSLDPPRVVLFGNPRLGTPLMPINPRAGLDLPQKMLVYRTGAGALSGFDRTAPRQ